MSKNPMQEAKLSLAYGALKTNLDCCHAEDKFLSQHMSNFLGFLKKISFSLTKNLSQALSSIFILQLFKKANKENGQFDRCRKGFIKKTGKALISFKTMSLICCDLRNLKQMFALSSNLNQEF